VTGTLTGTQLRALREKIGVDPFVWAALLGVHVSTVYRWEALKRATPAMESLPAMIIDAMAAYLARASTRPNARRAIPAADVLKDKIDHGLIRGGTLNALRDVLELVLP
jgi:hypothetical protein